MLACDRASRVVASRRLEFRQAFQRLQSVTSRAKSRRDDWKTINLGSNPMHVIRGDDSTVATRLVARCASYRLWKSRPKFKSSRRDEEFEYLVIRFKRPNVSAL